MGTYHSDRNDVIETDDIQDLLGVHINTEADGSKTATLKVSLDPRKDWEAVKQFFLHVTNGVYPRMLGPITKAANPSQLHSVISGPVSTSTSEESSTSTESTQETSTEPTQTTETTQESSAESTGSTTSTEVTSEAATTPESSPEQATQPLNTTTTEG